jgi:hypothetical protein
MSREEVEAGELGQGGWVISILHLIAKRFKEPKLGFACQLRTPILPTIETVSPLP